MWRLELAVLLLVALLAQPAAGKGTSSRSYSSYKSGRRAGSYSMGGSPSTRSVNNHHIFIV
eukprot:COSAG02_NODE_13933_length_1329_cov_2.439837_1_plen_61_part_00